MTFVDLGAEIDRLLMFTPTRYPVLNREPREQIGGRKWHLIWERDGGACWMCLRTVPKGSGEIDHVIPRSSFAVGMLKIADRSDNLRVACGPCNQDKSNFTTVFRPRVFGVSSACEVCSNEEVIEPGLIHAYCGRCGLMSRVPNERWLL